MFFDTLPRYEEKLEGLYYTFFEAKPRKMYNIDPRIYMGWYCCLPGISRFTGIYPIYTGIYPIYTGTLGYSR